MIDYITIIDVILSFYSWSIGKVIQLHDTVLTIMISAGTISLEIFLGNFPSSNKLDVKATGATGGAGWNRFHRNFFTIKHLTKADLV